MLYWKYAFLFDPSGLHWTFTTCFPHITGLLKTFQCYSIIYRIKFKPLILISEAWLWWFCSPSSPSHNQHTHTHTHTHMLQTWVSESWVSTCKYHSFFWTYPYTLVLPRVPLPSLCNKYYTTTSPKTQTHKQICSITAFHGGNTPIMANFNWLMWCHWMQSWEEMGSDPPWWNISIIIS